MDFSAPNPWKHSGTWDLAHTRHETCDNILIPISSTCTKAMHDGHKRITSMQMRHSLFWSLSHANRRPPRLTSQDMRSSPHALIAGQIAITHRYQSPHESKSVPINNNKEHGKQNTALQSSPCLTRNPTSPMYPIITYQTFGIEPTCLARSPGAVESKVSNHR